MSRVSIIIPTYNEKKNIETLIPEIFKCKYDTEVIVVDDNSPDGTANAAKQLAKKFNVKTIQRKGKLGLASAVIEGFKLATGEVIGFMDADLSHPPEAIPKLIEPIIKGQADIAIGSRYMKGGGVEVWPIHRRLTSRLATILARPLTKVKDPLSGFFFMKRQVIDGVNLNAKGYKIGLEILVKGKYSKTVEVPYLFRNRLVGKSKLSAEEHWHYINNLAKFYWYKCKSHYT